MLTLTLEDKILDTYYYYDRPLFFSEEARLWDGSKCILLTLLIDEDEETKAGVCMSVRVSQKRLRAFDSNSITLRQLFKFPEYHGGVYFYIESQEDNQKIHPAQLPMDSYFHDGGLRLRGFTHAQQRKSRQRTARRKNKKLQDSTRN